MTFTGGPAEGARTNGQNVELTFDVAGNPDPVDTVECRLDGGEPESCGGGSFWRGELPEGEHTVTVVATDVNDVESAPAVRTFFVDTTAPAPAVTAPTGTVAAGPLTISGTATTALGDAAEVQVLVVPLVEGAQMSSDPILAFTVPVVDGAWSVTTPDVPAGNYVLGAEQVDDVGNLGVGTQQVAVAAPAAAATPTPAPAATPTPAPVPAATPVVQTDAPKSALAKTNQALTRSLASGGIEGLLRKPSTVATFQAPGAGKVTVRYRAKDAKGKTVLVGTGTTTVTKSGKASVRVKLTKAGRAGLKTAGKRVALTVQTSFTPKGAKKAQTSSTTVTLKRKK